MSDMQIQQVLAQMRALVQSAGGIDAPTQTASTNGPSFANLLQQSLQETNEALNTSGDLTTRFVAGDDSVSLSEAVIASQTASLELEAVVQVRNRLLSAYQEIMNMPI